MIDYKKLLNEINVDAFWVTDSFNKRYLTNFTGSACEVIITKEGIIFITDGRYKTQIKDELDESVKVIMVAPKTYYGAIIEILNKYDTVGFESNHVTYDVYKKLKNDVTGNLVDLNSVIENLRLIKKEEEIALIQKAVDITDETFSFMVKNIKVGQSEKEVKMMLENKQVELGAKEASFDCIVASGTNTAKPHARATDKLIEEGDIITLDFGCIYKGYCSDMTRTFFMNGVENNKNYNKLVEVHNIVREAMELQIKNVKAGIKCIDIDKLGRDLIARYGYGEYFMHGTGHGVGIEIHEEPYLNSSTTSVLQEGNVITIEPGIYIEGIGGVRIEQDILVLKDGYRVLNKSCVDFDVINK